VKLEQKLAAYEKICGRNANDIVRECEIIYNPTKVNRFENKYNKGFDCSCKENEELT
jgi:hypothetical protein